MLLDFVHAADGIGRIELPKLIEESARKLFRKRCTKGRMSSIHTVGSRIIPVVNRHNVAGLRGVIKMQLDSADLKLPQHILDSTLDGRIVRAVASDEFLDDGMERSWRQFRVWDTHRISYCTTFSRPQSRR